MEVELVLTLRLVFHLAQRQRSPNRASGGVGADRVVFLALRGDEGEVECLFPVPLDLAREASRPEPRQLALLGTA